MLDRDDLTFATCYQIAGEIKEDWDEGRSETVDSALAGLFFLHEPEYIVDTTSIAPLDRARYMAVLETLASMFKVILANADGWQTPTADMVKKEMICRVKDYEYIIKTLSGPLLGRSMPTVHIS